MPAMRGIESILAATLVAGVIGCGGGSETTGAAGTGGPTGSAGTTGSGGTGFIGSSGCGHFSGDDPWKTDVSGFAVNADYTARIANVLGNVNIHPDFGPGFGIPITVVPANQTKVPVTFDAYADESDPGPYPFPGPTVARVE